nr:peptidyl-prolyl cis-trans isomerase [Salmonella sp. NCTC 7297]
MIQGGGFNEQMQQKKPNPPIKNEADNGLRNTRGTIAMARTADKDSATSQFLLTSRITLSRPRPARLWLCGIW